MCHYVVFELSFPLKFSCSASCPSFSSNLDDALCYHDLDFLIRTLQMLYDFKISNLFVGIVSEADILISYISASDLVSFCIHSKCYCDCEILGGVK